MGLDAFKMGLVLSAFFRTRAVMQLPADRVIDSVEARINMALGRA